MDSINHTLQKVKSSKQWKFVNDKAKAAMVSLDEKKTATTKALNHDVRPPKEKHVQSIFKTTHSRDTGTIEPY